MSLPDDPHRVVAPEEVDDLQRLIAEKMRDPAFRSMYRDTAARHDVLDAMVNIRKGAHLTQEHMATRMNVSQPTVSEFESEQSDPKLSTLQRYARALGGHIEIHFHADPLADLPDRAQMREAIREAEELEDKP